VVNDILAAGAHNILVWTSDAVREAQIWNKAFAQKSRSNAVLSVFTPKPDEDPRKQLRDVLRQYMVPGSPLDALIVDQYGVDMNLVKAELDLISLGGTEEDAAMYKLFTAHFQVYDPADAVVKATYDYLRKANLFSHRIAKPAVKYYESQESESRQIVLVETTASYVNSAHVSGLN